MEFRYVTLALLAASTLCAAEQPPTLRLTETIAPTSYRAALELDPSGDTFAGRIQIKINLRQPSQTVWLNATQLDIAHAEAALNGAKQEARILPGGAQFVGLAFDAPLPAGAAELNVQYTGHVRMHDSSGVFRSEDNGNKFLFTQFESTDARAAFPCFDEPSFKVPWQLTLTVPKEDDVVSNTPVAQEKSSGSNKVVEFTQTKPLPSYLVAFAVGKFDFVPAGFAGKNRAPVRIVTPRGHAAEAKYAADVTATILTRLEDYFGIPFPYEKSDQVAIPTTYGFGAMENAGMVTYAQNILLAKPERDTTARERSYAEVAAHELAHQWFGDLVTTAWWNDIWLNEAFATWMEQKLIAEWKPEWETRVADVNSKLGAEAEDTLLSARKVRQDIQSMDDISNAFDGITYDKGAAIIGMFESWMGDPAFQRGVRKYLRQYAFRNATAPEFLAAVSEGGGKDITQPFSTFLNQPGVPLVSMSVKCGEGAPVVHLEQQRSLVRKANATNSDDQHWQIPVCVRYGNGSSDEDACTLFGDPRMDWKLRTTGCPAWLNGNAKAIGYYRVAYEPELLHKLTTGDAEHQLTAPERVDLLGNAQALANTGEMAEGDVLRLVPAFRGDPNRFVVERTINIAGMPLAHLVPEGLLPNYRRFVDQNFAERAHQMGWISKEMSIVHGPASTTVHEDDNIRLLRPALVKFVATAGDDQKLADDARALTQRWFSNKNAIPANNTAAVLETAAYYGDKVLFDKFLTELKQTKDRQERRRILEAMMNFRDPDAIRAGMEAMLHGDIPFIEGSRLLFAGQQEDSTRKLGFEFMKEHIDQLAAMRPNGAGADAGARFVLVGRSFCDAQSKKELQDFFEPRVSQFVGAPRVLAQTLEGIDDCIARKNEQQASVEEFLRGF